MEAINIRKAVPSLLLGALIGFVFYAVARALGIESGASGAMFGAVISVINLAFNQRPE